MLTFGFDSWLTFFIIACLLLKCHFRSCFSLPHSPKIQRNCSSWASISQDFSDLPRLKVSVTFLSQLWTRMNLSSLTFPKVWRLVLCAWRQMDCQTVCLRINVFFFFIYRSITCPVRSAKNLWSSFIWSCAWSSDPFFVLLTPEWQLTG